MISICYKSSINSLKSGNNSQTISPIEPCINKYNSKGTNYPSRKDDLKTFKEKNQPILLNVLYINKVNIYPAYNAKHNLNLEK